MKSQAKQYTIRGVPDEVDRILRERAVNQHLSLNQLIIEELSKSTIGFRPIVDFTDLVGKWVDDPAFDEVIESQRQIHPDDWK